PLDYLPRTNYVPACCRETYGDRIPRTSWFYFPRVTEYYRLVNREMLSQSGERTLLCAIAPPGAAQIHACFSVTFEFPWQLVSFAALAASLPIDFRVKSTGMGHANKTLMEQLPVLTDYLYRERLHLR